jgi:mannosyltransferase
MISEPVGAGATEPAAAPPPYPPPATGSGIATFGVLLCCALAAFVALRRGGTKPLWVDEAASLSAAGRSIPDLFRLLRHVDANSGLYYVLLHFWLRLGHGEAWDRALSAVFGVGAVAAAGWCAARCWGPVAAVGAAFLLALNPFWLFYAQDARTYSLALLLAFVSTATLVAALQRPDRARLFAYGAATTMLLYANLFSVLFVAGQIVVLARRGRWRPLLSAWVATALCSAPLALYVVIEQQGQISWILRPTMSNLTGTFLAFTGHGVGLSLLLVLGVVAVLSSRARHPADLTLPLVTAATAPFAILWLLAQGHAHFFVDRYLIASLAAIVLVGGAGFAELWKRHLPVVAIVVAGVIGSVFASYDLKLERQRYIYDDGRSAALYVAANGHVGDVMVYAAWRFRLSFDVYFPRSADGRRPIDVSVAGGRDVSERGLLFTGDVTTSVLAANLRGAQRVWVVGRTDGRSQTSLPVSVEERLRRGIPHDFGDMSVVLWSAPPA